MNGNPDNCVMCSKEVYITEDTYPYCSQDCQNIALDEAIKKDNERCKIRSMIVRHRDDAEKRVSNIESFGPDKNLKTKEYFQARADVLNDLLMVLETGNKPCSCC